MTVMWTMLAAFAAMVCGQMTMGLSFFAAFACLLLAMHRHDWLEMEARYKKEDAEHQAACERIKNLFAREALGPVVASPHV